MTTVCIDEDMYGLTCLYPAEGYDEAVADMKASMEAGERNRDPNGCGWTDMYVIQPPTTTYESFKISRDELGQEIGQILPRATRMIIGTHFDPDTDPSSSWDCITMNPHCYCIGHYSPYIVLSGKDDMLSSIQFEPSYRDKEANCALRRAFQTIEKRVPSIVVDYQKNFIGPLADDAFMDKYFAAF